MTISISVRDFRGIAQADVSCSPIGLLISQNGGGKSSVAEAAAACLTGKALSRDLTKGEAGQLVRDGAKTGQVRLKSEGGEARMSWPDCEHSTTGAEPPHASVYAAGIVSIADLSPKERAAALEPYLHATPTKEDLALAMEDKFSDKSIGDVWDELQMRGWDQTAAGYEIARRDAGRDWGKVAGENFGSDKARSWRPTGWDDLFDPLTVDDIEAQVKEAQAELEGAIAGQAVDEAELAGLRDIAGKLDERQAALADAKAARDAAAAALAKAKEDRGKLAEPAQGAGGIPCPHCGEPIALVRDLATTTLEKFKTVPEAENKKRRTAVATADGEVSRLASEDAAAGRALALAESSVALSEGARDKIAGMGEKKGNAGLVTRAREGLLDSQLKLVMRKKVDAATAYYRTWMRSDLLLKILVPSGLRARKLGEAVGLFNSSVLAPLCEVAGWAPVNLTEALMPRFGERTYQLASKGEQWRVRATLQAAMAKADGSSMLIIDDLPDIDKPARNGLFRLIEEVGIPGLLCMALSGIAMPDLTAAEMGATWLIDDQTAKPFNAVRQAA